MKKTTKNKDRGFSLVEAIFGIFLLAILALGIYGAFAFGMKVSIHNRLVTTGTAIAEKQIEAIKSMKYTEIGVRGGIPAGNLEATETEVQDGTTFTIQRSIRYIDDPLDEKSPKDETPADYKQVEIKVSWPSSFTSNKVTLNTIISPPKRESDLNMGVLIINVVDGEGNPLEGAMVNIKNTTLTPQIDTTQETDNLGSLVLPGVPPASTSYQITVSKDGYETVGTYPPFPESPFNPLDAHLSVSQGQTTSKSFVIDKLSTMNITILDNLNQPLANTSFALKGGRVIGTTVEPAPKPVYYFDKTDLLTDSNGKWQKSDLGKGPYAFSISNPNYELITTNPPLNWNLASEENKSVTVIMGNKSSNILVLTVKEQETGTTITGASVTLVDSSSNENGNENSNNNSNENTNNNGNNNSNENANNNGNNNSNGNVLQQALTDANGIVYFPQASNPPVTLETNKIYKVIVSKDTYLPSEKTVTVSGITRTEVSLTR